MSRIVAIAVGFIAACKFAELPPIDEDARSVDAAPSDASSMRYALTLTVDGASTGAGSISVEPGGFLCSNATCVREFDAGTELTITVEGAGSLDGVASVSGHCSSNPCAITMDGDRSVTAQFVRYACVPNSASCSANALTECDAEGNFVSHVVPNGGADGSPTTITMQNYPCPMGCHATEPRCADITLGNGVEVAMETPQVSPVGPDVVLPSPGAPSGIIQINTSMFDSGQGLIRLTGTDGNPIDIPAQLVDQGGDAGTILVLKTRTFHLRAGSSLRAIGSHKLAIAAHFDIFVAGKLDLRGDYDGAGYSPGAGVRGVPGCFGTSSTTSTGATGGGASACVGGASSTGLAGGQPSQMQAPFVLAGCGGGRTTALLSLPTPSGGGLMLASRTKITLAAGAAVDLTGSGGGGSANFASGGAAGGHSVFFAPSIRVDASAVVSTRGGSGGAASGTSGTPGTRGPLTGTERALGVTCSGCGMSGAGGYEESGSCGGLPASGSGAAIAGGGGAEGWCVVYARLGGASIAAGTMKCAFNGLTLEPR